jgi:naringenin degradation protein FdeH
MPKTYRRIVTTNDANGKSEVLLDGPSTNESAIFTEMWLTDGAPHNHADRIDHALKSKSLEPPLGGSVFRFFRFSPMSAFEGLSDEQREQLIAQGFAMWNASHTRRDLSKNALMHQTRTTDYIIVLSGEVTLVLDKEERDLKPFDVVIQRGTNHAWINKGSSEALLMAVLVDDGLASEEQPGSAGA